MGERTWGELGMPPENDFYVRRARVAPELGQEVSLLPATPIAVPQAVCPQCAGSLLDGEHSVMPFFGKEFVMVDCPKMEGMKLVPRR